MEPPDETQSNKLRLHIDRSAFSEDLSTEFHSPSRRTPLIFTLFSGELWLRLVEKTNAQRAKRRVVEKDFEVMNRITQTQMSNGQRKCFGLLKILPMSET